MESFVSHVANKNTSICFKKNLLNNRQRDSTREKSFVIFTPQWFDPSITYGPQAPSEMILEHEPRVNPEHSQMFPPQQTKRPWKYKAFFFLSYTPQHSRIITFFLVKTQKSHLADLRNHKGCQGTNPSQLHANQMPYPLFIQPLKYRAHVILSKFSMFGKWFLTKTEDSTY